MVLSGGTDDGRIRMSAKIFTEPVDNFGNC
jgi:hypothetical protein